MEIEISRIYPFLRLQNEVNGISTKCKTFNVETQMRKEEFNEKILLELCYPCNNFELLEWT
jgi:hypothetical protein